MLDARTIDNQFNAANYTVPSFLKTTGWEDSSWHNNASPSFSKGRLVVYIECDLKHKRGIDDSKRLTLGRVDNEDSWLETLLETDSSKELEKFINNLST